MFNMALKATFVTESLKSVIALDVAKITKSKKHMRCSDKINS